MSTWRYVAVPVAADTPRGPKRSGEMTGSSAADVRSALRRIGWQVIDLRPVRVRASIAAGSLLLDRWRRHLRRRRRLVRSDLFDSLATMLESGVPVLEAVTTLIGASHGARTGRRTMLTRLRADLHSGDSFAEALKKNPDWFDAGQVAIVEAGQQRGAADVLRRLAARSERSEQLVQKLIGALAYPTVVALVGLGVVVFLSMKTLPEFTGILVDAGIEVPWLTRAVMAFGQFLAGSWHLVLLGIVVLSAGALLASGLAERSGFTTPHAIQRLTPLVLRRIGLAGLSVGMADLVRTGIPVDQALRITAPTLGSRSLRRCVLDAARRIEHGEELSDALEAPEWFDAEFRRLLDIGQASGELDVVLERLGRRYQRQSERLLDRLAVLLEPAVILVLAVLVGLVVVAAILPLLRLQEIL